MKAAELRASRDKTSDNMQKTIDRVTEGEDEATRVAEIVENTREILDDLDEEFRIRTGFNSTDVAFLFVAVALQVVRQYFVTKFPERLDDQSASEEADPDKEEHSNRKHKYYNPSIEEIISNPVPFDAIRGSNGSLKGGGKFGHRITTLGHDPILGLVIGTANIATSTLTTNRFVSYHIVTGADKYDHFGKKASTRLVIKKTVDKITSQGMEGKTKVAVSFCKEIQHLHSDINSIQSLPLPFLSVIDVDLANKLASYGIDMGNVVQIAKQAELASLINFIIAIMHRLYYDGETEMDEKLYEVKTRKILSYSNCIASATNIMATVITGDLKMLDIGGLMVTVHRVVSDAQFIRKVKEEFVFGSYKKLIMGEDYVEEKTFGEEEDD